MLLPLALLLPLVRRGLERSRLRVEVRDGDPVSGELTGIWCGIGEELPREDEERLPFREVERLDLRDLCGLSSPGSRR